MKYLMAIAMLGLAGCASTQQVLSSAPREVIKSAKPASEVAFCIANKNNVPALTAPDGAQIIQIKNAYGAVGMIFSVYPDGSGSRIEVRKPIGVSIATHKQCY